MQTITESPKSQLKVKLLAQTICYLVNHYTVDIDMEDIESDLKTMFDDKEIQFKNYWQLLDDSANKHLITKFDTTEEYFFDAINQVNLPEWKAERLINECLIF